jgi:FkbM family methyltransferase
MNLLWKKTIAFLRLLKRVFLAVLHDGPCFGYREALRWHSVLFWDHVRSYAGLPRRGKPVSVRLAGKPVWLRPWTSDYNAYQQVFREQEYAGVEGIGDLRIIIDCGANIGLASIYFLNRFPECTVLAVEPDPENVLICRHNLQPYGGRAKVVRGAVWSDRGRLTVIPSRFGLAEKWSMQVRPFQSGDPEQTAVDAFDVPSLMACTQVGQVDLLKIDIERSELVLFSSSTEQWLPRVRNLVIELHDEECSRAFFSALEPYDYRLLHRGDLTYCLNLSRLPCGAPQKENAA